MSILYLLYSFSLVSSLIAIVIAYKKFGFLFNHYFFFNFTWLLLIFLSIDFNSYLKPVSVEVYAIFLLGLFFFNLTLFAVKTKNIKAEIISLTFDLRKRRLIELIVILGVLPAAYVNYMLIQSGVELWALNSEYWNSRGDAAYLYQQYQQLFLSPMTLLLVSTSFYKNYSHANKYSALITVSIACFLSILYLVMTGGGRRQMMDLFFAIILSVMSGFHYQMKNALYRPNRLFFFIVSILVVALIQWANQGRGKSESLIHNAVDGYTIFAPLFEYYLSQTAVFDNNTFGCSMFEMIVITIQYPFKLLGFSFYDIYNNDIAQDFVYVQKLGKLTNAQVSIYFYFFRDFNYLGIFIGPFIFAAILNWLYSFCKKNTFYLLFFLCAVLKGCLFTGYPFDKYFYFSFFYLIMMKKFLIEKQK